MDIKCKVCDSPVEENKICEGCGYTITIDLFNDNEKFRNKPHTSFVSNGKVYTQYILKTPKYAYISINEEDKKLPVKDLFNIYMLSDKEFPRISPKENSKTIRIYINGFERLVNFLKKRRKKISIREEFLGFLGGCVH